MRSFWDGFEKRAGILTALRGVAKKGRPGQAEKVLDYGAMQVRPKPPQHSLDYGAMNEARTRIRNRGESEAAKLNYSSGKPVLESKGSPVQTPASRAGVQPRTDPTAAKRLEHATKGITARTDWEDAIKEGA